MVDQPKADEDKPIDNDPVPEVPDWNDGVAGDEVPIEDEPEEEGE